MNLRCELYGKNKINTIGDLIKRERLIKGFSQSELAAILGLSIEQGRYIIKDYETRGIYPPPNTSKKLAKIFETGDVYFYDDYYDFIDKNYGEILKCWRDINCFTQDEASKLIKVSTKTWNRWENGKPLSRKNFQKLKKIMKKL